MIAVGGIALYKKTAEYHGRGAAGEKDFMAVFGIPSPLDDDVSVVLEEGNDLLGSRDALSFEDAPVGLVDHFAEDADGTDKPPGKLPAGEGILHCMALVVGELADGGFGVTLDEPRVVEKIPVGLSVREEKPLMSPILTTYYKTLSDRVLTDKNTSITSHYHEGSWKVTYYPRLMI